LSPRSGCLASVVILCSPALAVLGRILLESVALPSLGLGWSRPSAGLGWSRPSTGLGRGMASPAKRNLRSACWRLMLPEASPDTHDLMVSALEAHRRAGKSGRGLSHWSLQDDGIMLEWTTETSYSNVLTWVSFALSRCKPLAEVAWCIDMIEAWF